MTDAANRDPIDEGPQLEERLVIFLDLLGFSAATQRSAPDTNKQILELLTELASFSGDFRFIEKQIGVNMWDSSISPAATVFSDNIVLSAPTAPQGREAYRTHPDIFSQYAVMQLRLTVGAIAARALELGFLIRGGMTLGDVYHHNGIVFGEAMLRAYELERRVAHFPRVALSPELTDRLNARQPTGAFLEDSDGILHLNYFNQMFHGDPEDIPRWRSDNRRRIANEIDDHRAKGRLNELAKWRWFSNAFDVAHGMRPSNGLHSGL